VRISELSSLSGVSPASIKFYTREGLLPPGERTGYNQTDYTQAHVDRLRLIRSLIDVGGLAVSAVARVLGAVDDPGSPLGEVLGAAQRSLPQSTVPPSAQTVARVEQFVADHGWTTSTDNPGVRTVAAVLDGWVSVGRDDLAGVLPAYAAAADLVAAADVDAVARGGRDRDVAAQTVVVGTVLGDQLLAGLRRIAQEHHSKVRYG
jgi:DNA-binding transcriptional MerR regulator